jgi:NAD(P)-dependent dehydrogenase (short-subunit alcohol dehydrogenase family)
MEVVVIAGSPALPLTRSLSLDMERKGFIVFIVAGSHEDESMIQNLSRPDIRPLSIDITDVGSPTSSTCMHTNMPQPPSAGNSIEHFARYLQAPHAAIPNGKRHHLSLKAVILIPSLNYQTSPIATIPPSSFADLFNTHLLQPILTIQAFLPLLTARLSPADRERPNPKVLVCTPSIISSINPPFHAPEATVCSALSAFTEVLAAELRPLDIPVTHMQLGTFDFAGFTPAANSRLLHQHGLLPAPEDADALPWPDAARHVYGRNFVSQSGSAISAGRIKGLRGTALREFHNAVFDVIDGSITSGTVRVGLGASVYGFVGRWVPRGLVAWMMGIRRAELPMWQGNNGSSAFGSPRSAGSDGEGETGSGSFVTVPPLATASEVNVWKEG